MKHLVFGLVLFFVGAVSAIRSPAGTRPVRRSMPVGLCARRVHGLRGGYVESALSPVILGSGTCYPGFVATVEQTLRRMLGPREDVDLAVLFGSVARGAAHASSDVDLGIRWRGTPPSDRDALLAAIERSVGRSLDLTDLDQAPPQLRFEIARDGVVIVERQPGSWSAFRARACIDWWDFAPIARRIHRAALARLQRSVHGSG